MSDLTPERRRELVLAAIDRIKHFEELLKAEPLSSQIDCYTVARSRFDSAEREFAWQWRNVEALLRG